MSDKTEKKGLYEGSVWHDKPHNFLGLPINFTRYILTTDKLITSKGFLNIHEDEILLYRVVDKSVKISFWQKMFGCGTLIIHVRDSDTPEKLLVSVKHPRKVSTLLDQLIDNSKTKYMMHGKDMYGAMSREHYHDIDVDGDGIPDALE